MARVLITGGAGFIGSHVADLLLDQGHEVRVYDRLVEQVHNDHGPRHVPTDAEFIHADVRDAAALRKALEGVDAIVHHAATSTGTRTAPPSSSSCSRTSPTA